MRTMLGLATKDFQVELQVMVVTAVALRVTPSKTLNGLGTALEACRSGWGALDFEAP
jgi:hypothetical protein